MSSASCDLKAAPMEENFIADLEARAPGACAFAFAEDACVENAKISRSNASSESASSFWWSTTTKSLFFSRKWSLSYVTSPA